MEGDVLTFAQFILQVIEFIWPGHQVHPWQRGIILRFGRFRKEVGPGVYWLWWWFWQIIIVDMAPGSHILAAQTITTKDGQTLTFAPEVELEVLDAKAAALEVMAHEHKSQVDTLAACAETLSDLPDSRLNDPEKRKGVIRLCLIEVNKRLEEYGMRCNDLTFPVFVRNMRNYKLWQGSQ